MNKLKKIITSSLAASVIWGLAGNGLVLANTNTDQKVNATNNQVKVDLNDTAPAALKPIFIYTVNNGDTLWGISKKFRITLSRLLEMNPQLKVSKPLLVKQSVFVPALQMTDPLFIYFMINQKPFVQTSVQPAIHPNVHPKVKPAPAVKAVTTKSAVQPTASFQMHVVKKGETLYSIAKGYGISVDLIVKENHISSPTYLKVGDQLLIPMQNKLVNYQVKSGDTLTSLAKKFHTTFQAIAQENSLKSNMIKVGEWLTISQK